MPGLVSTLDDVAKPSLQLYTPETDGLRACAVIAVFAYHTGLFPVGWAGVWLFFILSGFASTRMLLGAGWQLSAGSYRSFLRGRVARLWPLYLLYAGFGMAILVALGRSDGAVTTLLALLTFTYNFRAVSDTELTVVSHLWPVSTVMQFYLFYPFIFEAARRWKNAGPVVAVAAVSLLLRAAEVLILPDALFDAAQTSRVVYYWSFGQFDAFAIGALIAFRVDLFRNPSLYRGIILVIGALAAGIIVLDIATADGGRSAVYALFQPFIFPTKLPLRAAIPVTSYIVMVAFAAAALVTAIGPDSMARQILRWPPLVRVGTISYGVYVWHLVVLIAVFDLFGADFATAPLWLRIMAFVPCLGLSIWIAHLSYRFFESRFHRRIGAA